MSFRLIRTRFVDVLGSVVVAMAISGCGHADQGDFSTAGAQSASPTAKQSFNADTGVADTARSPNVRPASLDLSGSIQNRQVIRQADLDVRVEKVETAEKSADGIVQATGGYLDSTSSTDLATDHPSIKITVRVPVSRFESTIDKFESLGVRLSKTINSQDVTGHIIDLDAKLKTLSIEAEDYRNMLKSRGKLSEIFAIRNELADVQNQLEDISAQRKSQVNLAALSTITLTLEQNAVVSQTSSDPNWFTQAWASATTSAVGVLRFGAVGLLWIAAFIPFWLPVLLILRRALRPVRGGKVGLSDV